MRYRSGDSARARRRRTRTYSPACPHRRAGLHRPERQPDSERRPAPRLALHHDIPTVLFDDLTHQGETDTGPADAVRDIAGAVEANEDPFEVRCGYADTPIGHLDERGIPIRAQTDEDLAPFGA